MIHDLQICILIYQYMLFYFWNERFITPNKMDLFGISRTLKELLHVYLAKMETQLI